MLQFGNAMFVDDPQNNELMPLIGAFQRLPESRLEIALKVRDLVKASDFLGRSLLVYARLMFWGYISEEMANEDLATLLSEASFDHLGAFQRVELVSCLGPNLASTLINLPFSRATQYRDFNSSNWEVQRHYEADEVWLYTPPPTGFFSIIENIILAQFLCALQKKEFRLDERFELWWRYPVPFRHLFQGLFLSTNPTKNIPIKLLTWVQAREVISAAGLDVLQAFVNFKKTEYSVVKRTLQGWMALNGWQPPNLVDSAIFYIRGGDKLVLETMVAPSEVLADDIRHLCRNSSKFFVLSDDYKLADDFARRYPVNKIENITDENFRGYFLQNNTARDVRAIVFNYVALASAKYSMSCPSSNLVNAAHCSNPDLQLLPNLSSTPVLKYGYL